MLTRLFAACNRDWDYGILLMDLALRAGLLWECTEEIEQVGPCHYFNLEEEEVCANCGAPKPQEE